jgi:hypothetical protein
VGDFGRERDFVAELEHSAVAAEPPLLLRLASPSVLRLESIE